MELVTILTVVAVITVVGFIYAPNQTKGIYKWLGELTNGAIKDTKAHRANLKKQWKFWKRRL